jgi:hypothetical protein
MARERASVRLNLVVVPGSVLNADISALSWWVPVVRMVSVGSSLSRRRIVPLGAVAT